ncbi:MAG: PLP-dependent aminotransferase family protein [Leifsonia flava]
MAETVLTARSVENLLGDWRAGGAAAYLALAERIRLLMLDGRIPVDTRLPAERELSERLGVSRTTVTAAYRHLREAGYLDSVRGSGSAARLPGARLAAAPSHDAGFLDFSQATTPAIPGLADDARAAVEELPLHLGGHGFDPVGIPSLREALAQRYSDRGLPTSPDQIMVTIGAQHAIALLARTLVSRGDRAVIEVPTYPHSYEALRAAGARLVPVGITPERDAAARAGGLADDGSDDDGADEADDLVQAISFSNPALAYLIPDFHNPTGRSMTVEARERILAAASRQGTIIVADETTAEMDIDRQQSYLPLAAYGDAVMIGSVGKTVWGGLRLGWIRAEAPLIRRLVANRSHNDLGTPILDQLVVKQVLRRMDEVLAIRREQLRVGRDHLEGRLAETFPEWTVPHVNGGLATWVNLGTPVSSQLALGARAHGLIIAAGPRFGIDGAFERFLRIPIGYTPDETDRAVEALARSWAALGSHPVPDAPYLAAVV